MKTNLKLSANQYRNIKGVRYELWTANPGDFAAEILNAKSAGLKYRVIDGQLYIGAQPITPQ